MAKQATLTNPGAKAHYSESTIDSNFDALNTNFDNYLHLRGSKEASNTMTGPLAMGSYKITGLATPTNPGDAVTKAYADGLTLTTIPESATGNTIIDADADTYIKVEATTDDDTIVFSAGTSGGTTTTLTVVGDDASAAAAGNPYIKFHKYVEFADDVRLKDDDGDSYIVVSPSGANDDHLLFVAGGTTLLTISGADSRLEVADNLQFTTVAKGITDIDADTKILLEKTSDDDIIRLQSAGTEALHITATLVESQVTLAVGDISSVPTGVTKSLVFAEGTQASAASDLADAQVVVTAMDAGSGYAGESLLLIDTKTGASSKATVKLGANSIIPDLHVDDATDASSSTTGALTVDGGVGIAKKLYVGTDLDVDGTAAIDSMAADHWPSCWGYLASTATTQDYSTAAEVSLDTEVYDTNTDFDTATGRFTPTAAGKYLVVASTYVTSVTHPSSGGQPVLEIRKNGATSAGDRVYSSMAKNGFDTENGLVGNVVGIFDMNGSTDYVSMYLFVGTDTSVTVQGGAHYTYLTATRVA